MALYYMEVDYGFDCPASKISDIHNEPLLKCHSDIWKQVEQEMPVDTLQNHPVFLLYCTFETGPSRLQYSLRGSEWKSFSVGEIVLMVKESRFASPCHCVPLSA